MGNDKGEEVKKDYIHLSPADHRNQESKAMLKFWLQQSKTLYVD